MMFKLMVALKISVVNGDLTSDDVMLFLKAGGSLDKNVPRRRALRWTILCFDVGRSVVVE